ncbi:Lrp/AsnC family transcriptional regulator, partial [Novosphingobium sp. 1949]
MLDDRDLKILALLQRDADMPAHAIAEQVAMSPSACSRRIVRLREEGYVLGTVAQLDRHRLDLDTTVYVILRARHSGDWLERFRTRIGDIPEILECHRLAGNFDYLLKVVVRDVGHYDEVYKRLIATLDLTDVSAYISMETIKDEHALPLGAALRPPRPASR